VQHTNQTNKENVKVRTPTYLSLLDEENKICYQYTIKLNESDGIMVLSIKERFTLHNMTSNSIQVSPLMFNHMDNSQVCNILFNANINIYYLNNNLDLLDIL